MCTLLNLRGNIPSFFYLTDGRFYDSQSFDKLLVEDFAYYLTDEAYVDFKTPTQTLLQTACILRCQSQG